MRLLWRIIKYSIIVLALVLALDVGSVLLFAKWRPEIKKADAIIVLGAAINTPALNNRTKEALRLYQDGKADALVLSGGKISEADISEAGYMQKLIKKNTQVMPTVVLEDQSHNTWENIVNSKAKIPEAKSVIIVSDEFHLARAIFLAYRNGFTNVQWSSPKPDYYSPRELRRYYIREMEAMIGYIPIFITNK